jgi:hypothetical protein
MLSTQIPHCCRARPKEEEPRYHPLLWAGKNKLCAWKLGACSACHAPALAGLRVVEAADTSANHALLSCPCRHRGEHRREPIRLMANQNRRSRSGSCPLARGVGSLVRSQPTAFRESATL